MKNSSQIMHLIRSDEECLEQLVTHFIGERICVRDVPQVMKINSFVKGIVTISYVKN
jgi:hypothetical protein